MIKKLGGRYLKIYTKKRTISSSYAYFGVISIYPNIHFFLGHHMVSLLKLPFFSIIQFKKFYPSLFFKAFEAFCPISK